MKKLFFGQPPSAIKAVFEERYQKKLDKILHFTAEQAGSTIKLKNVSGTYKTSTDGKVWTDYTLGDVITLENAGDKVYFSARTQNSTCYKAALGGRFSMTGKIAAGGNIQYLLDSTGARMDVPALCYEQMFGSCSSLTQAPELPATTLATQCYYQMFGSCSSLTAAPTLPATTLANKCYKEMFIYCSSLTQAPELPATTLADMCYEGMFMGCSNLKIAIADPLITGTTVLDLPFGTREYNSWNSNMFAGTGGTFTNDPQVDTKYICYQQLPSTLRVMLDWEASSTPANASLFVDGVAKMYNTSFNITPGSALTLSVVCNESAYRFTRFSFEDPSVNHSAYNYSCSYTPSEGATEISAIYNQNWV